MKFFALQSQGINRGQTANLAGERSGMPSQFLAVLPGPSRLSDSTIAGDILAMPYRGNQVPARRLVVLVPPGEFDETALARRVWQLAVSTGLPILFVTLVREDSYALYQRQRLARLASAAADPMLSVQAWPSSMRSWPKALEQILLPGDLLICLADHRVADHLIRRKALGELLARSTSVPVYILRGLEVRSEPNRWQGIRDVLAWMTSIIIVAAFFALQVGIDRSVGEPFSTVLFCLTVVIEFCLILILNSWIGKIQ
jgi:hypothetical protein